MQRYVLLYHGRQAVCPECSGLLVKPDDELRFKCIDCGTRFKCVDSGLADNELIYEKEGIPA